MVGWLTGGPRGNAVRTRRLSVFIREAANVTQVWAVFALVREAVSVWVFPLEALFASWLSAQAQMDMRRTDGVCRWGCPKGSVLRE